MKTALKVAAAAAVLVASQAAMAADKNHPTPRPYSSDYERNGADYQNNSGYNPSAGYYSNNGNGSTVNGAPATTGRRYSHYNGDKYLGMHVDSWSYPGTESELSAVKHAH